MTEVDSHLSPKIFQIYPSTCDFKNFPPSGRNKPETVPKDTEEPDDESIVLFVSGMLFEQIVV